MFRKRASGIWKGGLGLLLAVALRAQSPTPVVYQYDTISISPQVQFGCPLWGVGNGVPSGGTVRVTLDASCNDPAFPTLPNGGETVASASILITFAPGPFTGTYNAAGNIFTLTSPSSATITATLNSTAANVTWGIEAGGEFPDFSNSCINFPTKAGAATQLTATCTSSRFDVGFDSQGPSISEAVDVHFKTPTQNYLLSVDLIFRPSAQGDLTVTRIIPVQVIHSSDETIPMIANKPTVVRVYVKSVGQNPQPVNGVSAQLHVATSKFTRTLEPFNGPITALPYTSTLPPTDPPDFNEATLDFRLPGDLIGPGAFSLQAQVVPPPGFQDANPANDSLQTTITMQPQPQGPSPAVKGTWTIGYISICTQQNNQPPVCPPNDVGALSYFVTALFPVALRGVNFIEAAHITRPYTASDISTKDGYYALIAPLRKYYHRLLANHIVVDNLIGFVPPPGPYGGIADLKSPPDVPNVVSTEEARVAAVTAYANARDFTAKNVAHELGHLVGLRHTNLNQPPACLKKAEDSCTTWPYQDPTIQYPGYNVGLETLVPKSFFDIMSYCSDPAADNIWISPFDYVTLFQNNLAPSVAPENSTEACNPILDLLPASISRTFSRQSAGFSTVFPQANGPAPSSRAQVQAAAQTLVLVSGTANRDGSPGTLDAAFPLTTTESPSTNIPSGNYCLRYSGAAGTLGSTCFNLAFFAMESATQLNQESFSLLVAQPSGTTRIDLVTGGQVVASLVGGAAPPSVRISAPTAGSTWDASVPQSMTWTGNGSGPNSLMYMVDASSDGGNTWIPLTDTISDVSLQVDASHLQGPQVYFRVTASDGLNSSAAQVGPVTLTQTAKLAVSPTSVDFRNGLISQPVSRQVTLTNSGSAPVQIASVNFSDPSFTLDSPSLPVTVYPGASVPLNLAFQPSAAGAKSATMTIASNATATPSITVPLKGNGLTVTAPDASASPSTLDFGTVTVGASGLQTATLQSFGPAPLQVNSVNVSGAGFALVTPQPAFTLAPNGTLAIAVQFVPQSTGVATGSLSISTSDPAHSNIAISLKGSAVTQLGGTSPLITPAGVVNAGSFAGGGVSPGEIVTVFGSNIGPLSLARVQVADGQLATSAGGTQVLFDGTPAPMIYAVSGQVSAIVPYEVSGEAVTQVQVVYNGTASNTVEVPVALTAPALFTAYASGKGPGAILNQDSTINSAANPAAQGSIVILYGTGEGQTSPLGADGLLANSSTLPAPFAPVTATIGGQSAKVLYAGAAPSLVAGVLQVNAVLPANIGGGAQPVVLTVGGVASQTGVTVAIAGTATSAIGVSPSAVNFGSVQVGQKSAPVTVTIQNTGSGALTVSGVSINGAQFAATGVPALPFTIAAGGQSSFQIAMTPTSAGTQTGTLTIASNDSKNPSLLVSLTGTGTAVAPQIPNPASLNFGTVQVGTSKTLALSFSNTGTGAATITAFTPSGAGYTASLASGESLPFTLNPNAAFTLNVTFTPATAGTLTGSVTIAVKEIAAVTANLTGVGSAASITVSPTSLAFGNVNVGQTSAAKTVTLTNSGSANGSVTLSTSGPFAVSPASLSVPANGTATASVTFAPTAALSSTGSLTVSGVATPVALTGTGVAVQKGGGTGNIVYLKVEGGQYDAASHTLKTIASTWDTDNTTQNWMIGISAVGLSNPLLNNPGKAINIPAGSYYAYFTPNTWGSDIRITVGWADKTTDISYFHVAGYGVALPWPNEDGTNNITVTYDSTAVTPNYPCRVFQAAAAPGCSAAGDVLLLKILGGTGGGATTTSDVTLKADGGTFNAEAGLPGGAALAYFVTRLTPPSYPATLKSVQIYFSTRADGLPVNTPISVIAASNPGGSSTLSLSGNPDIVASSVTGHDAFLTFNVPARTITSGDFAVGFAVANPANIYPADLDQASPSQQRSYVSLDGKTFYLMDSIGSSGNLAIRAVATVNSTSGVQ